MKLANLTLVLAPSFAATSANAQVFSVEPQSVEWKACLENRIRQEAPELAQKYFKSEHGKNLSSNRFVSYRNPGPKDAINRLVYSKRSGSSEDEALIALVGSNSPFTWSHLVYWSLFQPPYFSSEVEGEDLFAMGFLFRRIDFLSSSFGEELPSRAPLLGEDGSYVVSTVARSLSPTMTVYELGGTEAKQVNIVDCLKLNLTESRPDTDRAILSLITSGQLHGKPLVRRSCHIYRKKIVIQRRTHDSETRWSDLTEETREPLLRETWAKISKGIRSMHHSIRWMDSNVDSYEFSKPGGVGHVMPTQVLLARNLRSGGEPFIVRLWTTGVGPQISFDSPYTSDLVRAAEAACE